MKRLETAGCVKDFILSSCSLQLSSFLFRSFSNVAILVFAMVSSLLRNSIWTDSGLGFGLDLLFFWVEEWVREGWAKPWGWGAEVWGIEKTKESDVC